jgi:hypothetical protein
MDIVEYNSIVYDVNLEAETIIQHQRIIAGIHRQIDFRLFAPLEQDDIYRDHYGQLPIQGNKQIVDGVAISTHILHQTGARLSDIVGADMLYEIESNKYALIQYKKANKNYRVSKDENQLEQLLANCPSVCRYKTSPPRFSPVRINGYCGCWYRVGYEDKTHYVHACEANLIFGDNKSASISKFRHGISKTDFDKLFASCTIGALVAKHDSQEYIKHSLDNLHLVFEVRQTGSWQQS